NRYPSTSIFCRRGVEDFEGAANPPPLPTGALPGTPAKVAVLCDRASKRLALWHPNDAAAEKETRVAIAGGATAFGQAPGAAASRPSSHRQWRAAPCRRGGFLTFANPSRLVSWQVFPLFSPPRTPSYNGACEASIGTLKKRTDRQAQART